MTKKTALALALLPLITLAACAADPGDDSVPAATSVESSVESSAGSLGLEFDDLPDCGLVAANATDLIGDFVPSPDGLEEVFVDAYAANLNCSWVTPETVSGDAFEIPEFGGLGVGIHIENDPSTRDELEAAGLVHEYAPADNAGAVVASLNSEFDPDDELSMTGVTVHKGNVSIVIVALGVYLDASNIVGDRTNATAIDAALRMHEAMREG